MSQYSVAAQEAIHNPVLEYPEEITGIAVGYMVEFKKIHDRVVASADPYNTVLWLSDEDFVGYHLYTMGTYGDVFLDNRKKCKDTVCWRTQCIIANTSDMVRAAGALINRKSYPDVFVEEEIKNRLSIKYFLEWNELKFEGTFNKEEVSQRVLSMKNAEVLQMYIHEDLDRLLYGSGRLGGHGIISSRKDFTFHYRARVATLQASGLFDKILAEARPKNEWIHQFVWPV